MNGYCNTVWTNGKETRKRVERRNAHDVDCVLRDSLSLCLCPALTPILFALYSFCPLCSLWFLSSFRVCWKDDHFFFPFFYCPADGQFFGGGHRSSLNCHLWFIFIFRSSLTLPIGMNCTRKSHQQGRGGDIGRIWGRGTGLENEWASIERRTNRSFFFFFFLLFVFRSKLKGSAGGV